MAQLGGRRNSSVGSQGRRSCSQVVAADTAVHSSWHLRREGQAKTKRNRGAFNGGVRVPGGTRSRIASRDRLHWSPRNGRKAVRSTRPGDPSRREGPVAGRGLKPGCSVWGETSYVNFAVGAGWTESRGGATGGCCAAPGLARPDLLGSASPTVIPVQAVVVRPLVTSGQAERSGGIRSAGSRPSQCAGVQRSAPGRVPSERVRVRSRPRAARAYGDARGRC